VNQALKHEGVVSLKLDEKKFNDYLATKKNVLTEKFNNYLEFQSNFAEIGISKDCISGKGWELDHDIGVYCLKTAMCITTFRTSSH
jgi:hypothetical protein